nr:MULTISPECIES: ArsR family transcriptional regulator [Paenibacillus]
MLLAQNKPGFNVNPIAGDITLSRPAVSHHLKVLKHRKLLCIDCPSTT